MVNVLRIFLGYRIFAGFFTSAHLVGTAMFSFENSARGHPHDICPSRVMVAVICCISSFGSIMGLCEYNHSNSQHFVSLGLQLASYPLRRLCKALGKGI